jgi:hypothetical protein
MFFMVSSLIFAEDKPLEEYFYFPHEYQNWNTKFIVGASLSKLPTEVVEEEINSAPILNFAFRMGLPGQISTIFELNTNYFTNYFSLAFQHSFLNKNMSLAGGVKFAGWFGHPQLSFTNVKATGMILSPYISTGYDFGDFVLSATIDVESYYIYNSSEGNRLGEWFKPLSGFGLKFSLEQPLWKNHWVNLGMKLNFSKFYYQSWLSFTTIDEFLVYPEFSLGFVL